MPRDLRQYGRQTNIRLIAGSLILLFLIGLGLIWWRFGANAALLGLLCMLGGISPLLIIAFALWLMELISKNASKN